MLSRRTFLSNLALGVACLCVRFRPECAEVVKANVVDSGQWGEYRYVIYSAYRTFHTPAWIPILVRR